MGIQSFIETDRLSISPLMETDAAFIQQLVNTEGWLRFIGNRNISSISEAIAYIQRILANTNISYWVVSLKDDGEKTGIITYIKRDYLDHPDIGFAFLPIFLKSGYAFEATKAVLQHLIREHNLTYILATTMPQNITSISLITKIGLVFEKEMEPENEKLKVYGASADALKI